MAPPRKPPGERQDTRPQRRQDLVLVGSRPSEAEGPQAPPGLLKASRQTWAAFWAEAVAQAGEDIDRVVAERWIRAYDEWLRSMNALRKARLVKGSTGQPVLNPLAKWVASREQAMRACELQLGIGLKNRADLGITMGQAQLTAAELNRMTQEEVPGDGDEVIDVEEAEVLEEFEEAE